MEPVAYFDNCCELSFFMFIVIVFVICFIEFNIGNSQIIVLQYVQVA